MKNLLYIFFSQDKNSCDKTFCEPDQTDDFQNWEFLANRNKLYIHLYEERITPTPIAIINCKTCDGIYK